MPIAVGGTNITDIRIGSTVINSVYVGSQLVWSRMSLTVSALIGNLNGTNQVIMLNALNYNPSGTATAKARIRTNPTSSVTWTFSQDSGATATTQAFGTFCDVSVSRLASAGVGTTTSVVTARAFINGSQVAAKQVTLKAQQDYI
jgi:hypothetical protein|tara:strand:+ start:6852 stop:7286 length:435 start_codon:yes stop_codon:yes gene_type:complete